MKFKEYIYGQDYNNHLFPEMKNLRNILTNSFITYDIHEKLRSKFKEPKRQQFVIINSYTLTPAFQNKS